MIISGRTSLPSLPQVKGRLERIEHDFPIFVDFAHTEDALKNVLLSLKEFVKGKIYLVFGCGGDRDRDKRPKMGKLASELANYVILTSDNPRSEDPLKIIEEIASGINGPFESIPDRRAAIAKALSLPQKEDILLIAGKGHEVYQTFCGRTIPFDDRQVVLEILGK